MGIYLNTNNFPLDPDLRHAFSFNGVETITEPTTFYEITDFESRILNCCILGIINFSMLEGSELDEKCIMDLFCANHYDFPFISIVNPNNRSLITSLQMQFNNCLLLTKEDLLLVIERDEELANLGSRPSILKSLEFIEKNIMFSDETIRQDLRIKVFNSFCEAMGTCGVSRIG